MSEGIIASVFCYSGHAAGMSTGNDDIVSDMRLACCNVCAIWTQRPCGKDTGGCRHMRR